MPIQTVAVLGAGTMGSGIASHLANAGLRVYLLDIPARDGSNRNLIAEAAIQRQRKIRPPAFFDSACAERIVAGNIEDDLPLLAGVDWIAEAVVERLDIKESLYRAVEKHRRPGTPVSSNTSTIPLSLLTRKMPESFKQDFCITHFFNPVRYMQLLEIVAGPATRPEIVSQLTEFLDRTLGKVVVACKDTPGFLGNRVGVYAIQVAVIEALAMQLTVEEADAVMGRPVGWPKTGVFRLYDLIGLDLMLDVLKSMREALPKEDPFHSAAAEIPLIRSMVDDGFTGNKGRGGFFRRNRSGESPRREAIDLQTGEYRPAETSLIAALGEARGNLRRLVEHPGKHGQFAWRVLSKSLSYAASMIPDVCEDMVAIDEVMKLGFSWANGPFEMVDALGVDWFTQQLESENADVPEILRRADGRPMYRAEGGRLQHLTIRGDYRDVKRAAGVVRLSDQTRANEPLLRNAAASLWDVGDGVACVEFHTKANALVPETMELLDQATSTVQDGFRALVIHNDSPQFSVGVNLQLVLENARRNAWDDIERMLVAFQSTCRRLKLAPFPVVGAPSGMSLGGGFEVLLHCDALVAHSNTVTGLVETNVGLIPAGGGCKELLVRWSASNAAPTEAAVHAFKTIGLAETAASPPEAQTLKFMLPRDRAIMNRDRILAAAKDAALTMAVDYQSPPESTVAAAGADGRTAMAEVSEAWDRQSPLAPHDWFVAGQLARVLSGGETEAGSHLTEERLLQLEREAFLTLVRTPETLARIEHMLSTGRPLRN